MICMNYIHIYRVIYNVQCMYIHMCDEGGRIAACLKIYRLTQLSRGILYIVIQFYITPSLSLKNKNDIHNENRNELNNLI